MAGLGSVNASSKAATESTSGDVPGAPVAVAMPTNTGMPVATPTKLSPNEGISSTYTPGLGSSV